MTRTKLKFAIIFILLVCNLSWSQTNSFQNFTNSWYVTDFLELPVGGGGGVSFEVNNNVLTLSFSAGFSPVPLKTGYVVDTEYATSLPNLYLGYIQNTSYEVRIKDNFIYISSTDLENLEGFEKTFTVNLLDPASWLTDPMGNEIYIAPYFSDNQNYFFIVHPREPIESLTEKSFIDAIYNISYKDELGRDKENINIGGTPTRKDLITYKSYDNKGREVIQYLSLPYDNGNKNGKFLNSDLFLSKIESFANYKYDDNNYKAEKSFENSPRNLLLEAGSFGLDFQMGSNNSHTNKYNYEVNDYNEVKHFEVLNNVNKENTALIFDSYYPPNQLKKIISKNENWQPDQMFEEVNTIEEFYKNDKIVLKRNYSEENDNITLQKYDTYYVYDDFGNLTYVIPPLASDQIIVPGNQTFRVGSQINFPWTDLVAVDRKFAEEYNKRLEEYENEQILNADIKNEYDGQGGFTVTTLEGAEELTLNLNFSANKAFALKKGELLSLKPYGGFKDTEVGRIKGDRYEYIFLIKNNSLIVEGDGEVSSISQSFNSSQKLTYSYNYPWVDLMELDPGFVKEYKSQLEKYKNEDILNVNIQNKYDGTGGLNISVDKNDMVNVTMNLSSNTPFPLKKGMVIPLKIERKLEDRQLGVAEANGYHYFFSIKDNQLYISGSGVVHSLSNNFSAFGTMDGDTDPETVEGLCYIYHYDARNRLVEKKIPGKGWEHIVYDKLDRPVLTQDANMRLDNEWFFTKYDTFDRPVYTGIYTYVPNGGEENSGRLELKDLVSNQSNPVWWETRGTSQIIDGVLVDYTNSSFPMANLHLLTVNYYDEYFYGNINVNPIDTYSQGITEKTKGLSTNSKVRAVGTNNWIDTFTYYDEKARPIFVKEFNGYFNSEMKVSNNYDFIGNILQTKTVHFYPDGNAPTVTINDIFTYDHQNRLKKHTQSVNGQHEERILENFYDELGQLVSKDVGGNAESLPLQEVNYDYNIRGWLKSINPLDGSNNLAGDDLFSFGLNYNQPLITGTQALFNGNISETHWKTKNDNLYRSYAYRYDALNRLMGADYHGGGLVANTNDMEDYGMAASYDKNGNIINLERKGAFFNNGIVAGIDVIDDLVYDYRPKTNQLERVTDSGYDEGFKDVTGSDEDYAYDANGNLKIDKNKEITKITYNHLNLSESIIFRNNDQIFSMNPEQISYTYDALGNKLSKSVFNSSITPVVTNYINGFIYEDNVLKLYPTEEGYVEPNSSNTITGVNYVYQYKDHLGNIRLSYKKDKANSMYFLDDFSDGNDGWQSLFSLLNSSSGQLFVDTPDDHDAGATRTFDVHQGEWVYISFDFSSSGPYKFPVTIEIEEYINGNWQQNNVFNSTEQSTYYYQAYQLLASGTQIRFKISSLMDFTIDNFKVEQNAILIVDEKNYYPFGLEHKGYNSNINDVENNYQTYNGKELNKDLGLDWHDFGARNYDAALGRWMNLDPLAEQMRRHSPYNYAFDNPIYFIDPDGMAPFGEGGLNADEKFDAELRTKHDMLFPNDREEGRSKIDVAEEMNWFTNNGGDGSLSDGTRMVMGVNGVERLKSGFSNSEFGSTVGLALSFYNGDNSLAGSASRLLAFGGLSAETVGIMADIEMGYTYKYGTTEISALERTLLHRQSMNALKTTAKAIGTFFAFVSIGMDVNNLMSANNIQETRHARRTLTSDLLMLNPFTWPIGIGGHISLTINPTGEMTKTEPKKLIWCFVAGTKILLDNGSEKDIENMKIGDRIKSVDIKNMKIVSDEVISISEAPTKKRKIKIVLENGIELNFSSSHPIYVKEKGWCSFDNSTSLHQKLKSKKLKKGDYVYLNNNGKLKESKIISLIDTKKYVKMYNLVKVKNNNNFFANKILVHNKYVK